MSARRRPQRNGPSGRPASLEDRSRRGTALPAYPARRTGRRPRACSPTSRPQHRLISWLDAVPTTGRDRRRGARLDPRLYLRACTFRCVISNESAELPSGRDGTIPADAARHARQDHDGLWPSPTSPGMVRSGGCRSSRSTRSRWPTAIFHFSTRPAFGSNRASASA